MKTLHLEEPALLFGLGQQVEDPRDGLTLFGPFDPGATYGVRWVAVGPGAARVRLKKWVEKVQSPVWDSKPRPSRPFFPGFESAFRIPWSPTPSHEIDVPDLDACLLEKDRHQRVFRTVEAYTDRIIEAVRKDGVRAEVWFVVIPDDVYRVCRPLSQPMRGSTAKPTRVSARLAKSTKKQPLLFAEDRGAVQPYFFEPNFHNQLKARLLHLEAPTQIVRESTIAHREILRNSGRPLHDYDATQSSIAWNLSTAAYYKTGGRPWKLSGIREGVCYLGLVFKHDERTADGRMACCAAQMFLDSGDGVVFKGAVGPWYSEHTRQFHLDQRGARDLLGVALHTYARKWGGAPRELFIHGRTRFNTAEWDGFKSAVGPGTNLVGVRITEAYDLKAYGPGKMPPLRGLAAIQDERTGYLWTRGVVPRLRTYVGLEVPSPLAIEVSQGSADIEVVLRDVLALTKLNYNACIYGDGVPVTLKFADAVGEVLTAGPIDEAPPLPFHHYI